MEQKLTILLVEDETTYAQLIELFLLDYGHQIHTVYSITDARHLLQHQFDLLIADVNLPDGDGIDFAQLARAKWPELSGHVLNKLKGVPSDIFTDDLVMHLNGLRKANRLSSQTLSIGSQVQILSLNALSVAFSDQMLILWQ